MMTEPGIVAMAAVDKIIEDIEDRVGLKGEWSSIDQRTRDEIRQEWGFIIASAYQPWVDLASARLRDASDRILALEQSR